MANAPDEKANKSKLGWLITFLALFALIVTASLVFVFSRSNGFLGIHGDLAACTQVISVPMQNAVLMHKPLPADWTSGTLM